MLTAKKSRFCDEYLIDLNGKQAAIRAGFSRARAAVTACEFLNDPEIVSTVAERKAERSARTAINADFVLGRLVREISADVAELIDPETGDFLPVEDWPLEFRTGLVTGITYGDVVARDDAGNETVRRVVKKVTFVDRAARLQMLGKHVNVKAFVDTLEVKADTFAADVAAALAQIEAADVAKIIDHQSAETLSLPNVEDVSSDLDFTAAFAAVDAAEAMGEVEICHNPLPVEQPMRAVRDTFKETAWKPIFDDHSK